MGEFLKDFKGIIISLLGTVVTFYVTQLESLSSLAKGLIYLGIVIVIIALFVFAKLSENKNLSNTSVIRKSKRYTKNLLRVARKNEKTITKNYNNFHEVKQALKTKKTLDYVSGKEIKDSKDKIKTIKENGDKQMAKYYKNLGSYVSPKLIDARKKNEALLNEQSHAIEVFNQIYDCLVDVERILLQLEQHSLRIRMGKYVLKCTNDIDQAIHAYVDYLGWTTILLGKTKKGIDYVKKGLALIDYKIKTSDEGSSEYYKYILQKARALRHIGTTYYTYKHNKDNLVIDCINESIKLMDRYDVKEYFSKHDTSKYVKMVAGIRYNKCLYDYYEAIRTNSLSDATLDKIESQVKELENNILNGTDVNGNICIDKDDHRLIKVLTLRNQLLGNIHNNGDMDINDDSYCFNKIDGDLKVIERIMNNNVYFDEAMEVYLSQKVVHLYDSIYNLYD